jgi:hypothetical protein
MRVWQIEIQLWGTVDAGNWSDCFRSLPVVEAVCCRALFTRNTQKVLLLIGSLVSIVGMKKLMPLLLVEPQRPTHLGRFAKRLTLIRRETMSNCFRDRNRALCVPI